MAFYNPQRVVFNPDTGVIQNAGKVGGVLYDIMSKSFDDKVKANEFQQEQDLRKQQMEFNQAMQNNQLLQNPPLLFFIKSLFCFNILIKCL